jgi:hypothetical protein
MGEMFTDSGLNRADGRPALVRRNFTAGAAHVVNFVLDSTGQYSLSPDSLPQALTYNGPGGAVDTITVGPDENGYTYRQTYTYTGSNVTGISAWVKL